MLKDFVAKSCATFLGYAEAVIENNGSYME